jgi:hypothetical protein
LNGAAGPTGEPGSNASINSVFVWSSQEQSLKNITQFQLVTFNKPQVGPTGSAWTSTIESGYTSPTTFKCPKSGWYLLTYKLDIRSGQINAPTDRTNSASVLLRNNIELAGSTSMTEAPGDRHIYATSNTILCQLAANDLIQLAFWGSDMDAHIGEPSLLTTTYKPTLPGTTIVPSEATASIVFSRISS